MSVINIPKPELCVILHYVECAVFDGAISKITFGAEVAEHVMNTVPEKYRKLIKPTGRGKTKFEFQVLFDSDDIETLEAKRKANAKKVWAALNGETYEPLFMRRSLIECLPETYRKDCRREIYRGEGYLMVVIPDGVHSDAGALHAEYADAARSGGALRADDGEISEHDSLSDLRKHQKELLDVIESATAELVVVEKAIKLKHKPVGVAQIG